MSLPRDRAALMARPDAGRWAFYEANAHRREIQDQLRREIHKGTIRVRPARGGGIRIVPARDE